MDDFTPDPAVLDELYDDSLVELPDDPDVGQVDVALDRLLSRAAAQRRRIEQFDRTFNLEIGRLNARRMEVLGSTLRAADQTESMIHHLAKLRHTLVGATTVHLPSGTITSRPLITTLDIDDAVLADWLKANAFASPELVGMIPKVYVAELRKLLAKLGCLFGVMRDGELVEVDRPEPGEVGVIVWPVGDEFTFGQQPRQSGQLPGISWTHDEPRKWTVKL